MTDPPVFRSLVGIRVPELSPGPMGDSEKQQVTYVSEHSLIIRSKKNPLSSLSFNEADSLGAIRKMHEARIQRNLPIENFFFNDRRLKERVLALRLASFERKHEVSPVRLILPRFILLRLLFSSRFCVMPSATKLAVSRFHIEVSIFPPRSFSNGTPRYFHHGKYAAHF